MGPKEAHLGPGVNRIVLTGSGYATERARQALQCEPGLDDGDPATAVLLIGQSADGSGWFANADQLASMLPVTVAAGRAKLVLDGAWAADIVDPTHHSGTESSDRAALERAYDFRDLLFQFWADSSVGSRVIFDNFDNIPDGG